MTKSKRGRRARASKGEPRPAALGNGACSIRATFKTAFWPAMNLSCRLYMTYKTLLGTSRQPRARAPAKKRSLLAPISRHSHSGQRLAAHHIRAESGYNGGVRDLLCDGEHEYVPEASSTVDNWHHNRSGERFCASDGRVGGFTFSSTAFCRTSFAPFLGRPIRSGDSSFPFSRRASHYHVNELWWCS